MTTRRKKIVKDVRFFCVLKIWNFYRKKKKNEKKRKMKKKKIVERQKNKQECYIFEDLFLFFWVVVLCVFVRWVCVCGMLEKKTW